LLTNDNVSGISTEKTAVARVGRPSRLCLKANVHCPTSTCGEKAPALNLNTDDYQTIITAIGNTGPL